MGLVKEERIGKYRYIFPADEIKDLEGLIEVFKTYFESFILKPAKKGLKRIKSKSKRLDILYSEVYNSFYSVHYSFMIVTTLGLSSEKN